MLGPPAVAGLVGAGLVVPLAVPVGAAVVAVDVVEAVPDVPIGVAAGVGVGKEVSGVGSGGNGFERTSARNWFMPSVVLLWRYLYHSVSRSFQTAF